MEKHKSAGKIIKASLWDVKNGSPHPFQKVSQEKVEQGVYVCVCAPSRSAMSNTV